MSQVTPTGQEAIPDQCWLWYHMEVDVYTQSLYKYD